MKIAAFVMSALTITTATQAAGLPRLDPKPNAPVCLQREYSAEHLRKNPGQLLEKMFVKLTLNQSEYGDLVIGEVVGVHRQEFYGNTAGCHRGSNGSLNCFIECDGGSFSLRASTRVRSATNFSTEYFPLFKGRMMDHWEEEPGDVEIEKVRLGDRDNALFRLVPAPVSACDEAIERNTLQGNGGC